MSDKRKTLSLPVKEAHDPRFGIFVAALIEGLNRRHDACPSIAVLTILNAVIEANNVASRA